ncbi:hypothetical protein TREMEDRAFT_68470 [Tremella mesenterica DSM 1558]|uniref:uncharacterized protein n=1 Tax=Tremella mesenterica (strain ATCC 24925 / CBS 8224 / DSM 1558 / NBRC 9311 / NRRL Y-6157 / RJB 2259-6 / UBC 559-6) TaxID=578456 RepID=UPI0003F4990B|nr:uncharacterized protein TREMEDRAFT_68470 [Tremella mesenterica DSM 1558]EIW70085.1 hypothetical protein TREMEDRAFT_68470 [Tremella mesenterica DSM 1558]
MSDIDNTTNNGAAKGYEHKEKDRGEVVVGAPPAYDAEKGHDHTVVLAEDDGAVHRTLQQRHLAMIAIGGAIGTGLFIGSGGALASAGSVGVWLAYALMAGMVWTMMIALGEMATTYPVTGNFVTYAARFVDESLGFALGINYWYSYAITCPTEIVAAQILISYWDKHTPAAAYITVMLVLVWALNLWGTRAYGEAEFWFSSLKVLTIVGLIICGIVIMAGGGPEGHALGFHYWRTIPFQQISIEGGDAVIGGSWGRFLAFWSAFVQAAFSFLGTEIIATTVGEAANARSSVKKAIKRVYMRLLFFYVIGILIMSNIVSPNDPDLLNGSGTATASPWVIAIQQAGIKTLPSIANACFLLSAWSAGNADVYASSRTLYGMAKLGFMPKLFARCTKKGLPWVSVITTCCLGVLAYMNTGGEGAVTAFNWLYSISSITGIITWWTILLSYIRFYHGMKKQGLSRDDLPYKAPWQPWLSYIGFAFFSVIIFFNGFTVFLRGNWNTSTFFAAYITIPIFVIAYVGWKVVKRTHIIPLAEIDFLSGRRELDEMQARDQVKYKPESTWQKIIGTLF